MRQSKSDVRFDRKAPSLLSLRPVLQEGEELEVIERDDDDMGAAVDICGFNETAYKAMDIYGSEPTGTKMCSTLCVILLQRNLVS